MVFHFKMSFSVAFSFDPAGGDGVRKEIQGRDRHNTITPSSVSHRYSQPQPASVIQNQAPSKPSRPRMHRFGHFQPTSMPTTVIDPGAETDLAKAKDRESLELLLRVTNHTERSTRAAAGNGAMSSGYTDYLFVQQKPSTPSSITSDDASVSYSPLKLPSDSGSDLVSSLQRLRVRGLAAYFEEMEKRSTLHPSRSSSTLVRCEGAGRDTFDDVVKEDDETEVAELEDWEMTMSNFS
jgi:hypothetical protein